MERVDRTQSETDHILTLHRQSFRPSTKPPYPEPRYMSVAEVDRERQADLRGALKGVPIWRTEARARIRADVEAAVAAKMRRHDELVDEQVAAARRWIDDRWEALLRCEPEITLEVVNSALSDNERPSAAVHVEGAQLSVVFLVPEIVDVPDREITQTANDERTTKPLTKTRRQELRRIAALGGMIATAKEVLAVAPRIGTVKVVGVSERTDRDFDVLLAAVFTRTALEAVDWMNGDTEEVFRQAAQAASVLLAEFGGRTGDLQPLDLSDEPELRVLAAALAGSPRDD